MGTKKTTPQAEELLKEEVIEEVQQEAAGETPSEPEKKEKAIPAEIDNLLRLYPQYKKLWVTKDGFVHPEGVSKAYTGNATLYENKYYQQNNN